MSTKRVQAKQATLSNRQIVFLQAISDKKVRAATESTLLAEKQAKHDSDAAKFQALVDKWNAKRSKRNSDRE